VSWPRQVPWPGSESESESAGPAKSFDYSARGLSLSESAGETISSTIGQSPPTLRVGLLATSWRVPRPAETIGETIDSESGPHLQRFPEPGAAVPC
jgi:hypothetical protein